MSIAFHLLKRILRYDLPLAAVGAFVTWSRSSTSRPQGFAPAAADLGVRFVAVACTAGFGVSFLLYRVFYRRELPLYTVCGHHIGSVALLSLGLLALVLIATLVGMLVALQWAAL